MNDGERLSAKKPSNAAAVRYTGVGFETRDLCTPNIARRERYGYEGKRGWENNPQACALMCDLRE